MSFKDKIFKNQSPWGSPPGGGGGRSSDGNGSGTRQDPPNLDDIIKNFQKTINKFSGGKSGGSKTNYNWTVNYFRTLHCKWSLSSVARRTRCGFKIWKIY